MKKSFIITALAFIATAITYAQPVPVTLNSGGGMYILGGSTVDGPFGKGGVIINTQSGVMITVGAEAEFVKFNGKEESTPNLFASVGFGSTNINKFYIIPSVGGGYRRVLEATEILVPESEGTFMLHDDYWVPYAGAGLATGFKWKKWQLGLNIGADCFYHEIEATDANYSSKSLHVIGTANAQVNIKLFYGVDLIGNLGYRVKRFDHESDPFGGWLGGIGLAFSFGGEKRYPN